MIVAFSAAGAESTSSIVVSGLTASHLSGSTAIAGFRFNPNGTCQTISGSNTFPGGNWVSPIGAASQWEIRATVASGATPQSGTFSTWLPLTSSRTWTLTRSSTGLISSNLTFEFRRVGGSSAETTVTDNTLEVEVL